MSNTASNSDLAGLGLDIDSLDTSVETTVSNTGTASSGATNETLSEGSSENAEDNAKAVAEDAKEVKTRAPREHVEVGTIEVEDDVPLTALTRSSGGSKYKFDELRAPVRKDDGSFSYGSFRADLQDGVDEVKLRRSVQSATTQENKKHKDAKGGFEGADVYYITRSVTAGGKFTGIRVYRVDGTIDNEG